MRYLTVCLLLATSMLSACGFSKREVWLLIAIGSPAATELKASQFAVSTDRKYINRADCDLEASRLSELASKTGGSASDKIAIDTAASG